MRVRAYNIGCGELRAHPLPCNELYVGTLLDPGPTVALKVKKSPQVASRCNFSGIIRRVTCHGKARRVSARRALGDKTPDPGSAIRIVTVLGIWAITHGPVLGSIMFEPKVRFKPSSVNIESR